MPYEYTANDKTKKSKNNKEKEKQKKRTKRSLKRRFKGLFFIQFHWLAKLLQGFGAHRSAGRIYKWLVAMDDDIAMYKLGKMYWWGYKFVRDPVKAIELIEYASIRGNQEAQNFKDEMNKDGLWRQGKTRDEFMAMFDEHIFKENKRVHSMHLFTVALYTILLVIIAYLLR